MSNPLKEFAREHAPGLFGSLRSAKDRVAIEWRVLRHLRARDLVRLVAPRRDLWRRELPVQRVRRHRVAGTPATWLAGAGSASAEGGHAWWLGPAAWAAGPLAALRSGYPADAGLKIVKSPGDVASGRYLTGAQHSRLQREAAHGHPQLLLAQIVLHLEGVGPRPYDLLELEGDDGVHVAYVSQDVGGRAPDAAAWRTGMARLRALADRDLLSIAAPDGFAHGDFREPDCNGNAFLDAGGTFRYVDFQNFLLGDYASYLDGLATAAAETSHFGDRSMLRGGRYLYQTVPGLDRPAKRDVANRLPVLHRLLDEAGCDLTGRHVLDIGCNIGMMLAAYLRAGAAWCHGWDMPHVVPHTERLLLGTGCTRFSLTGAMLAPERDLGADLPPFVRDGARPVVSFLALRGHVGWLPALTTLPWTHLIYEGHEGEDEAASRTHLGELTARTGARVASMATYRDGDSEPRVMAVVTRAA